MRIPFQKYHGTGNDFILIDNRKEEYNHLSKKQITMFCDRHFGIGADGLMLLDNKEGFDFEMKYYNADGAEGSMCGNGARCIIEFASNIGIRKSTYHFLAFDGEHDGEIDADGHVKLKMKDVDKVEAHSNHFIIDTGSPHFVKYTSDLRKVDVKNTGNTIRYSKDFAEKGINVNFIESIDEDEIFVRTYERGVEDETLSCGTGVTACALIAAHNDHGFNYVKVKTLGGNLSVEFDKKDDDHFENIWLIGPATFVFKGEINID